MVEEKQMSEQKWVPKIGDHVWHVCEYVVSSATLKAKGLEGFRNYGFARFTDFINAIDGVKADRYHVRAVEQG